MKKRICPFTVSYFIKTDEHRQNPVPLKRKEADTTLLQAPTLIKERPTT
jgi:hypothetical protein